MSPAGRFPAFFAESRANSLRVIASNGKEAMISAQVSSISGFLRKSESALRNSVLLAKCAECLSATRTALGFLALSLRIDEGMSSPPDLL